MTVGSGELMEVIPEVGRQLCGLALGLCNPSGPALILSSMNLQYRAQTNCAKGLSLAACGQRRIVGWV